MNDRRLSLKKERLAELTTEDLHRVHGGAPATLNVKECLAITQPGATVFGCTTAYTCPRPDDA